MTHFQAPSRSDKNVLNDGATYICQPEVTPAVSVSKLLVIQAELVEYRRVQIVDMDAVLHRFKSEVVRAAVRHSAAESTAGQQHAVTLAVVAAAILHIDAPAGLDRGSAPEFAADHNHGF